MKKKTLLIIMLIGLMLLPNLAYAKEKKYNTLNFKETLKEEEIKEEFKIYKPNSKAITIYMFRGKGCGYCRAFLSFMNEITDEYGKYFKLESYEVWNDQANHTLMTEVSSFLGEPATGVPYIIIGDKVFTGYAEAYNEDIKDAIKNLYDVKPKKRYDVFKQMKKASNSLFSETTLGIVIWPLIFTFIGTVVVMSYVNIKVKELSLKIDNIADKAEKKEDTKTVVDEHKVDKKRKK